MKEFKYIYLFKRTEHRKAKVILKRRMWNAKKIEGYLHKYFKKSRFKMTKRVPKGKWLQAHVKIGISRDVDKRIRAVNSNIFKSGHTEWFAMNIFELVMVMAFILWFAYRWWIAAIIAALILYGNLVSF